MIVLVRAALTAALATTMAPPLVGTSQAAPGEQAPTTSELPRLLPQGVELDLPDGDRFRVTLATDQRTAWGRHYDRSTRTWVERTTLLRQRNLYCGRVDARTSAGAVAVIAECAEGGWSDDQAPVASHALYSADLVTWQTRQLQVEAMEAPGISPDGSRAVWPQDGGYLAYERPTEFTSHEVATPDPEYTRTAVVADSGRTSLVHGVSDGSDCALVSVNRNLDGTIDQQRFDAPNACADATLVNVDSHTLLLGDPQDPVRTSTISRPEALAPWAVSRIAPAWAPGLIEQRGRGSFDRLFLSATDRPHVAVSSRDGKRLVAQTYDAAAQRWRAGRRVLDLPRPCGVGFLGLNQPMAVAVQQLECADGTRILATTDGRRFFAPRTRRALGVAAFHCPGLASHPGRPDAPREGGCVRHRVRRAVTGALRLDAGQRPRRDDDPAGEEQRHLAGAGGCLRLTPRTPRGPIPGDRDRASCRGGLSFSPCER